MCTGWLFVPVVININLSFSYNSINKYILKLFYLYIITSLVKGTVETISTSRLFLKINFCNTYLYIFYCICTLLFHK